MQIQVQKALHLWLRSRIQISPAWLSYFWYWCSQIDIDSFFVNVSIIARLLHISTCLPARQRNNKWPKALDALLLQAAWQLLIYCSNFTLLAVISVMVYSIWPNLYGICQPFFKMFIDVSRMNAENPKGGGVGNLDTESVAVRRAWLHTNPSCVVIILFMSMQPNLYGCIFCQLPCPCPEPVYLSTSACLTTEEILLKLPDALLLQAAWGYSDAAVTLLYLRPYQAQFIHFD